jgi:hypothetical protein
MWSRLFGKSDDQNHTGLVNPENSHLSRIDRCHELANITKKILLLQKHDAVLALEAREKGAGSVAYQKHMVTADLLTHINTATTRFNLSPAKSDPIAELEDVVELLIKIGRSIHQTHDDEEDTLNVRRYVKSKKTTLGLATLGVVATAISSGSFLVFLAGYSALVGATGLYQVYEEKCLDAYSFQLICELDAEVNEVITNINKNIARNKAPEAIRKTVEQRTWGAIALCANPIANQLPTDVKTLILSRVLSGHEKEGHIKNLYNHHRRLFKTAKNMLDNHPKCDVEITQSSPSL